MIIRFTYFLLTLIQDMRILSFGHNPWFCDNFYEPPIKVLIYALDGLNAGRDWWLWFAVPIYQKERENNDQQTMVSIVLSGLLKRNWSSSEIYKS